MWEQKHADIEYGGTQYSASTNPDGSVTYQKASSGGHWYTIRSDSRDPWLRSMPAGAKRKLLRKLDLSAENPLAQAPSDIELAVGGVAAVALTGLGAYLIYSALNPPGSTPDTATTLGEASSLVTIASIAV